MSSLDWRVLKSVPSWTHVNKYYLLWKVVMLRWMNLKEQRPHPSTVKKYYLIGSRFLEKTATYQQHQNQLLMAHLIIWAVMMDQLTESKKQEISQKWCMTDGFNLTQDYHRLTRKTFTTKILYSIMVRRLAQKTNTILNLLSLVTLDFDH